MRTCLSLFIAILSAVPMCRAQVSFRTLADGGINAISPEGAWIVGHALSSDSWHAATFMPSFEYLPEPAGATASDAVAVSGNGHVIAATSNATGFAGYLIIDGSITPLVPLPGTSNVTPAAISRDGSIIYGNCDDQVCRWTLMNGVAVPTPIPSPPPPFSSAIQACTTDGSIAAGRWVPELFADGHLISWTSQGGAQDLGVVTGAAGGYDFAVHGISSDGAAMAITKTQSVGVPVAMRWTAAGGLEMLPRLPGTAGFSIASGMAGDGSTMIGVCDQIAVLWTAAGVQSLPAILQNAGYDMSNWLTTSENGENVAPRVSANGRTLAGVGRYRTGPGPSDFVYRTWMVAFPICGGPDFNHDGDTGTDADIDAFFACLSGLCCATCETADFNGDGDIGTDGDIDAFFRVLAGGGC